MNRRAAFVLGLLILNLSVFEAHADARRPQSLTCYSMTAARIMLEADGHSKILVTRLGGITRPIAAVVDDHGDLILVGERDLMAPDLRLDDLVVALRTANALGEADCPGVSIDSEGSEEDPDRQVVSYFGGIENTHYGQVCFETDLLLKKMAFGFEPTGLLGVPNEWDLELDRVKSGYRQDPWVRQGGRSWLFPSLVRVSVRYGCAVLHTCRIAVMAVEKESEHLNRSEAKKRKQEPEPVYKIFAKTVTENYEDIARRHPILVEFRSLTALSALMKAVRELPECPNFDYWLEIYQVESVETPKEISTLRRGVSGLAYSQRLSGGVILSPEIYRASAGDPVAIRAVVLRSRPSPDALTWSVPLDGSLDLSLPQAEAISREQELLAFARFLMARGKFKETISFLTRPIEDKESVELLLARAEARMALGQKDEAATDVQRILKRDPQSQRARKLLQVILEGRIPARKQMARQADLKKEKRLPQPVETPGWHPTTAGRNLLEIERRLGLNYGSQMVREIYQGKSEWVVSLPITARLVLHNRWETAVTMPLELHSGFVEFPYWPPIHSIIKFPPSRKSVFGFVGGIGSITASTRVLLLDGLWKKPSLEVGTVVITPWNRKLVEGYAGEVPSRYRMCFGCPLWQSAHTLNSEIPIFEHLHLICQVHLIREAYSTLVWGKSVWGKRRVVNVGGGIRIPITPSRKRRISGFGFLYEQLMTYDDSGGGKVERRFSLFREKASRVGVFPSFIGVGVLGSGEDQVRYFFLSLPMVQKLLWSPRKWF